MPSKSNPILTKIGNFAFIRAHKYFASKDVEKAERIGAKLGTFGFKLDKKHRGRAIDNLRLAYPELSAQEHHEMALKCFQHFGRMAADFLRSPSRTDQEVLDAMEPFDITPFEKAKGLVGRRKRDCTKTATSTSWTRCSPA